MMRTGSWNQYFCMVKISLCKYVVPHVTCWPPISLSLFSEDKGKEGNKVKTRWALLWGTLHETMQRFKKKKERKERQTERKKRQDKLIMQSDESSARLRRQDFALAGAAKGKLLAECRWQLVTCRLLMWLTVTGEEDASSNKWPFHGALGQPCTPLLCLWFNCR